MKFLISFVLIFVLTANTYAWGSQGHRIVARIAEKHLTDKTKQALLDQHLLDDLPDGFASCSSKTNLADKLSCVASWADAVRKRDNNRDENGDHDFLQTNNWHFVDISLQNANFVLNRDCPDQPKKGVCGIPALSALVNFLRSNQPAFSVGNFKPAPGDFDRRDAVRFIVHMIGDLHQPLHTVEEGGGENDFEVTYLDQDCARKGTNNVCVKTLVTNLHHVWDSDIISTFAEVKGLSEKSYADRLNSEITAANVAAFSQGKPIDWVLESHKIAIDDFARFQKLQEFSTTEGEKVPKVDSNYVTFNAPLINLQLKRAGIRLARVLNIIFDK